MVDLCSENDGPYDTRDENYQSSEEEQEYYCEACDREFSSKEYLDRHMAEHTVCGIDGCTFSAHVKLVEKHVSMQHATGLYQRIKNLSTPEDIENWIQERKKRYPTKANIEQQKAEILEKENRSEIIKEKKTTDVKFSKRDEKRGRKRKNRKRPADPRVTAIDCELEIRNGVRAFSGTLNLEQVASDAENDPIGNLDDSFDEKFPANSSNDQQIEIDQKIENNMKNHSFSLSLVADYGTDSELDAPEEVPIKKVKQEVNIQKSEPVLLDTKFPGRTINLQSKSEIEEKVTKKSHMGRGKQKHDNEKKNRDVRNRRSNGNHSQMNGSKPNVLLHKLLSRSIQHERNLICQCLRYILDPKNLE